MINFMTLHGRGLICLALTGERCDQLGLAADDRAQHRGAVHRVHRQHRRPAPLRRDHRHLGHRSRHHHPRRDQSGHRALRSSAPGTRLSASGPARRRAPAGRADRGQRGSRPAGRAQSGRRHLRDPESPTAPWRAGPSCRRSREQHGLTFVTVAQLVAYRLRTEQLVHRVAEARIPTEFGEFTIIGYRNDVDRAEHVALVYGDIAGEPNVLVRMHSKCLTGDVFGSQRCDCGFQLHRAMELIASRGQGGRRLSRSGGAGHRPAQQAAGLRAAGQRGRYGAGQRAARASPPTCGTTASARRFCAIWGCPPSG